MARRDGSLAQAASSRARTGGNKCRWKAFRSEEHTSELQSHVNLVCRLLLEKKNIEPIASASPLGLANDPLRGEAVGCGPFMSVPLLPTEDDSCKLVILHQSGRSSFSAHSLP